MAEWFLPFSLRKLLHSGRKDICLHAAILCSLMLISGYFSAPHVGNEKKNFVFCEIFWSWMTLFKGISTAFSTVCLDCLCYNELYVWDNKESRKVDILSKNFGNKKDLYLVHKCIDIYVYNKGAHKDGEQGGGSSPPP